jgi:hypothetical protein
MIIPQSISVFFYYIHIPSSSKILLLNLGLGQSLQFLGCRTNLRAGVTDRTLIRFADKMEEMDLLVPILDLVANDFVETIISHSFFRAVLVGALGSHLRSTKDTDRHLVARALDHMLCRICGTGWIVGFSTVVPNLISAVNVRVTTSRQDTRKCTFAGLATDTSHSGTVRTISHGAELCRPPLTVAKVVFAMDIALSSLKLGVQAVSCTVST